MGNNATHLPAKVHEIYASLIKKAVFHNAVTINKRYVVLRPLELENASAREPEHSCPCSPLTGGPVVFVVIESKNILSWKEPPGSQRPTLASTKNHQKTARV